MENVADAAADHGDAPAVRFRGETHDYAGLWGMTGAFAAGLDDAGVGPDDRVGLYLPNLPQFVVGFHGTLRAGGVVVPMNPQYKAREIEHLLSDSGARVVVCLPDLVPFVEEVRDDTAVERVVTVGETDAETAAGTETFASFCGDPEFGTADRADDDVACQPYTSGTTGTPKGVLLTHENLRSNAEMAATLPVGGLRPDDRQLGVLPLFHIYGMTVVMNATLFSGASYHPLPSWDPQEAMDLVESEGLTMMHGVPAMYNDIVNQPDAEERSLDSLRMCGVGGAGIPVEVLRRFEDLFDVEIYEGYGLTETSPVTHFNSPSEGRRVGSIGRTLPGVSATVVDDEFRELPPVERGPVDEGAVDLDEITGELVVAGPNVMKGYHGRDADTRDVFTERDGTRWFHTGDIGYHDEDGFYYVVDRQKHTINTAGYNVYPREVEELLFEHEAVADAAVVGVPDDRRGETVKAFVVKRPGAEVTADEIREFCLTSLAEYKHPREVVFVDELPRTTTGKVQKFELRGE
ncbi:acyl-CoA synthetase (AMP-forming)/AMP-acid ligase II [Candidatus Halobonum tyrrellensis G22]|uniref:Acyl-CoA synthetase (AMP-forming)/AMP-acid ligase II n=1 Tax=Candidatus Halobonum tyrrellensis G22 TaxID=1324957 RepID=V4HCY0_9EURY|nr:acyl-CoA synthetase (AMP-forming)/AMP-acid ligase II [Candidatus Halobonum tyrrellensis G22]